MTLRWRLTLFYTSLIAVLLAAAGAQAQLEPVPPTRWVPGVPRDRLNVRVEADTLLIDADLVLNVPQGMQASHAEVQRTHYHRAFTLSRELDPTQVGAELSQGVLRVRIPKAEHAQPRRIEVQVG